mmetsp:Transcript_13877/g.26134  ORF Transcript_13877/g.26134 Transcript_13877/m.26134 type:complete len:112 (-) Transcript_13877:162-497(-)
MILILYEQATMRKSRMIFLANHISYAFRLVVNLIIITPRSICTCHVIDLLVLLNHDKGTGCTLMHLELNCLQPYINFLSVVILISFSVVGLLLLFLYKFIQLFFGSIYFGL